MTVSTTTRTTDLGALETTTRSSPRLLAPIIDGAETPERIPDEVALRAWLGTAALPPNPGAEERALFDGRVSRLGLDANDLQILTQEMHLYHTVSTAQKQRIDNIRQTAGGGLSPTTWSALVQEDQALSRLALSTYDKLLSALSPAVADRLREHLAEIKTKIKITPPPDMSNPLTQE